MLLRNFVHTRTWWCCHPKLNIPKLKIFNRGWCSSDTPFNELDLVVTVEDDTSQENVFCESEMLYFMGESSDYKGLEQLKYEDKPVPIKKTLAYTNKVLFGPLLETSAQKKRRLKREELDIDDKDCNEKESFRTKKELNANIKINPLVYKSENSHYLGIFPVGRNSKSSANDQRKSRIRINLHQPEDIKYTSQNSKTLKALESFNKKHLIFKKPPQYTKSLKNYTGNKVFQHACTRPQKLKVASWISDKEREAEVNAIENTSNGKNTVLENVDNNSIYNYSQVNLAKKQKDEESLIVNASENNSNSSFIVVDNSKFLAVPGSLDMNMIKNYPLFTTNTSASFISEHTSVSKQPPAKEDIATIGIFDNGYKKLPSVRKILEETMPLSNKIALEKWKTKMIKELGEEGFHHYRKGLLDRGMLLHGCIQSELSGVTPSVEEMPSLGGLWTSLKQVLPNVSDVTVLESRLIHPYLYYQGAVDCVGSYRGTPVLIEWKTSSKAKLSLKSMFDDPLQVVAYLGALNFDSNYKLPHHVETAMLVVAYDTGLPAHVHTLKKEDCERYWKIWCTRLTQFWKQLEFQKPELKTEEG
ncbi:uncharacterized protein LOC121870392 [Homarus americanus]|uniref:uncharacterized protein LOC121870392 n=1 Tax=Homarus americanus TaxID=6706 RepID=UPI001C476A1A|nr:uncharacterized protein LOC121870392 [Homarus americanus]XP_042228151.1 uncharacterized protein LOC121870392 [Homarus americanus]XP_042228152.1 uncharacterized protein LOC121870392 [Homarus americanus]